MSQSHRESPEGLYLWGLEVHSADKLREAFDAGLSPDAQVHGRTLADWVTHMYLRSPRFGECLECVLEAGVEFEDPLMLAVLRQDLDAIGSLIEGDRVGLSRTVDLEVTFTPLLGASPLHVAAEFGLVDSARLLLDLGADIEARAAVDDFGFNGQTPIFHTVKQHANNGREVLELLLGRGAATDVRLKGITWGRGFEWETTLLDVTLLSYTQAGNFRQFQRTEEDTEANVRLICGAAGWELPESLNVPNEYLTEKR